jgi:hypothetical protein
MNFSRKLHSPVKWVAILAVILLSASGAFAQGIAPPLRPVGV